TWWPAAMTWPPIDPANPPETLNTSGPTDAPATAAQIIPAMVRFYSGTIALFPEPPSGLHVVAQ
ncbi:MAG: hypothetical protein ACJ74Y_09745, partial [Bryobacteraceae bacterium]